MAPFAALESLHASTLACSGGFYWCCHLASLGRFPKGFHKARCLDILGFLLL
uniref:Uncharacterized protein n=1 Tax=Arundo donax TaxID=35708 RepID=A0A0A8Z541_ARUDO